MAQPAASTQIFGRRQTGRAHCGLVIINNSRATVAYIYIYVCVRVRVCVCVCMQRGSPRLWIPVRQVRTDPPLTPPPRKPTLRPLTPESRITHACLGRPKSNLWLVRTMRHGRRIHTRI